MNSESLPLKSSSGGGQSAFAIADEIPLTVRQAAVFLGVSPQTVYLWVERKQIPHLRVMGRNIRFLKSELEPFRAQFNQEIWWMRYRDRDPKRYLESTNTEDWQQAQQKLRERLQARDQNTLQTIRRGE